MPRRPPTTPPPSATPPKRGRPQAPAPTPATATTRTPKKTSAPKRGAWCSVFLTALRRTGNISTACEKAKITRSTAYAYRAAHPDFAQDWDEVLEVGIDAIEEALRETAQLAPLGVAGSVTAAIFLLKCRRPEQYNPPERREHSGVVGVADIDLTDDQAAAMVRLASRTLGSH